MPAFSPLHIVGNVLALMALLLGCAYAIDWTLIWFGRNAWVFCSAFPWIDQLLGHAIGVAIASCAFIAWAVSMFRSATFAMLFAGGLAIGVAPGVMAQYLDALSCRPPVKTASVPIPTPRPAHGG